MRTAVPAMQLPAPAPPRTHAQCTQWQLRHAQGPGRERHCAQGQGRDAHKQGNHQNPFVLTSPLAVRSSLTACVHACVVVCVCVCVLRDAVSVCGVVRCTCEMASVKMSVRVRL